MFSSLAPAAAASKNADGDEGRRSGPASPERLRHMHADVAELLRANTTPRRRRAKKPVPGEERRHARYGCAFEEEAPAEGGLAPPRMVWAKVKTYPRWPGQVFDPADASKQALCERKRGPDGAALVAFFGDGSFVWAGAAGLTPLRHDFARLAAVGLRSSYKAEFALALDDALAEVARRVDAGLSCGCPSAAARKQVFPNSGLRRGASGAAVDAGFARDALRGEALVGYVRALAVAPGEGADRLDHAIAAAQLAAFDRWRGKTVGVSAAPANRAATPKRTTRARGQDDDGVDDGGMVLSATPRARRATTPKRARPTGQDDGAGGSAMVFSATRASRATTPRRTRARGQDGGDASAGNRIMTRYARAAAAADAAFVRNVFRGDASVEHYASAKGLTPHAGAERRDLAIAVATPQPRAFAAWRGAPSLLPDEHTATHDATDTAANAKAAMDAADTKMARSTGGDDSAGDPGKWKMTSCISSREESSGCEDDVVDDDATGSEYSSEAPSHETTVSSSRWKDQLIVVQFIAIVLLVLLVCRLMME
ncbi:hypothetical protein VPH35_006596 [Triticum aestivum]